MRLLVFSWLCSEVRGDRETGRAHGAGKGGGLRGLYFIGSRLYHFLQPYLYPAFNPWSPAFPSCFFIRTLYPWNVASLWFPTKSWWAVCVGMCNEMWLDRGATLTANCVHISVDDLYFWLVGLLPLLLRTRATFTSSITASSWGDWARFTRPVYCT